MHPAVMPIDQLLAECDVTRTRRSGPGGQHRNKVETAIVIVHRPTGCKGQASERRSQEQNRLVAIDRLRITLAIHVRTARDERIVKPSERWQARTARGRLQVSVEHVDYAALAAEALDRLDTHAWQPAPAAAELGISTSQLVRFFAKSPEILCEVNRQRGLAGLSPLRV